MAPSREQIAHVQTAAGTIKSLAETHARFMATLRNAEPDGELGVVDVSESGELTVECLGQALTVRRRFVAAEGWPDRVEYLFLLESEADAEIIWAMYLDASTNLATGATGASGRSITGTGHAMIKSILLQELGVALLESSAFRPMAIGTRFLRPQRSRGSA
jgi:hypothetical protein